MEVAMGTYDYLSDDSDVDEAESKKTLKGLKERIFSPGKNAQEIIDEVVEEENIDWFYFCFI